ncbi:TetR/AcrR family transcriptional regulator [Antrihabitans sp. YC2-6]|uniref:TetR/AcrR family transcriptional regulator n=1 Tax=Antrihabitans sp. YC2-6 TaxID=2799498 RepID=UPI0018F33DB4|nr:TetR/AcrR family transcriptional regulator [Antrihabitans sp. YC2-6]MBJ8346909.1 TetR/AcrR family transcriptional regulator [Antrihabitans sp. YC2-6]
MKPASPRPVDSRRRSERSRQAILDAALDLVREVGYEKLSIEAIAARAGVGKQTIYRWWPSKGAVLFDAFVALNEEQGELAALPDTGDIEADLKAVLAATVDELNDPQYDVPMRALSTAMSNDEALAEQYEQWLGRPMREIKLQRLQAARDAGQISPDVDLDVTIDIVWGPVLNRWLQRTGPLDSTYTDKLITSVFSGIRVSLQD